MPIKCMRGIVPLTAAIALAACGGSSAPPGQSVIDRCADYSQELDPDRPRNRPGGSSEEVDREMRESKREMVDYTDDLASGGYIRGKAVIIDGSVLLPDPGTDVRPQCSNTALYWDEILPQKDADVQTIIQVYETIEDSGMVRVSSKQRVTHPYTQVDVYDRTNHKHVASQKFDAKGIIYNGRPTSSVVSFLRALPRR